MYFNDVHILFYVGAVILGGILGQFIDYCSKCFIKKDKIFSKKSFIEYRNKTLPNYILIIITAIIYVCLIYFMGIDTKSFIKNIDLIKYLILVPILEIVFVVDFKEQIIPNRLTLLMFEIGLVFVFIYGFSNINMSKDMLFGMLAGGGIFLIITLIGGLIAGKEAMGLRRCKINGSFRTIFWIKFNYSYFCTCFSICCNNWNNSYYNKKKKSCAIYGIWSIYCTCNNNFYVRTI